MKCDENVVIVIVTNYSSPLHPMPKEEQAKVRLNTNMTLMSLLVFFNCAFLRFLFDLFMIVGVFPDTYNNKIFPDTYNNKIF